MKKLLTNEKTLILAYDHGLEHGPTDFNLENSDPEYVFNIAKQGNYNAIAVQAGIAEKYYPKYKDDFKLIIKLNGKTRLLNGDPLSLSNCSLKRAVKLGASAVGYTLYLGSEHEQVMFKEFGKIVEEAKTWKIPVIAWMYPRGKVIENEKTTEILAYAARVGLELGADIIKIKYNNDTEGFKWVVHNAGKAKIIVAGENKKSEYELLKELKEVMDAGAIGMAIGRNVWQHKEPLKLTEAINQIIFNNSTVEEAMRIFSHN